MALTEEQLKEIALAEWMRCEHFAERGFAFEFAKRLIAALPKPEAMDIDWPEYHDEAMGCGLEDRNITDLYEAMRHGWDCAIERVADRLPETLYAEAPIAQPASAPSEQKPVDVAARPLAEIIAQIETLREEALDRYDEAIQQLCNKYGVMLATGHLSDMWQVKKPRSKVWKDDMDRPVHPIFTELNKLDAIVADIGLGPTNMMLFKPNASVKGGA